MMNTNTPIGKYRQNIRLGTGIQLFSRTQVKFVLGLFTSVDVCECFKTNRITTTTTTAAIQKSERMEKRNTYEQNLKAIHRCNNNACMIAFF